MDLDVEVPTKSKKSTTIYIVIGAAAGGSALVLLLLAAVYAFHHKRRAGRATKHGNPSGKTILLFFLMAEVKNIYKDFSFLSTHFFSFCW